MTLLLDTHAVIWSLSEPEKLGHEVQNAIMGAPGRAVAIASMSLLEIAILVAYKRITLAAPMDDYLEAVSKAYRVLPLDASVAASAMMLPLPESDPFDRIIVATAKLHDLSLVTKDRAIRRSKILKTIW